MTAAIVERLEMFITPTREARSDLSELLQAIFDRKYTGPVTLHFKNGVPKVAEFTAPQIRLGD